MSNERKGHELSWGLAALAVLSGLASLEARAAAPPGRYTLTADTVVDTFTGLTWQRAQAQGTYTWDGAKAYCAALSLGGFGAGSWRLPRKLELETILDVGSYSPAIDVVAFPGTSSTWFWTSSAAFTDSAYVVRFDDGYINNDVQTASNSARCVR